MNGCRRVAGFDPSLVREPLNRWILTQTASAAIETAAAIEAFRFNDAASAAYRFVWNIFCDWHLELAKPVLQGGEDGPARAEAQATIAYVLDQIFALLHPFMPFLTEELWAIKGEQGPPRAQLLALGPWPQARVDPDPAAEAQIGWLIDLVSEIRSVRSEMGVPAAAQLPLILVEPGPEILFYARTWGETIARLARVSAVEFAGAVPPGSVQIIVRGALAAIPLGGIVDIAAERARLVKEIAKERKEIATIDGKLGNADFIARAPEEVVEENRDRREAAAERIAKMEAALARLDKV
jgi:valyl-tRNA synthetase